jgi:hypothetical protein
VRIVLLLLFALIAVLVLGGAAGAQTNAAAAEGDQDAFILQIDVGRHSVLVDRALDGAGAKIPYLLAESGVGSAEPEIWRGLRETARDGVVLKEIVCAKGLVAQQTCRAFKAPNWISAEPSPTPLLKQLRTYEEELATAIGPFVAAGCKAGVRRTKDDMFCSIE